MFSTARNFSYFGTDFAEPPEIVKQIAIAQTIHIANATGQSPLHSPFRINRNCAEFPEVVITYLMRKCYYRAQINLSTACYFHFFWCRLKYFTLIEFILDSYSYSPILSRSWKHSYPLYWNLYSIRAFNVDRCLNETSYKDKLWTWPRKPFKVYKSHERKYYSNLACSLNSRLVTYW